MVVIGPTILMFKMEENKEEKDKVGEKEGA